MKDLISDLLSEQLVAALADTLIYSLLAGVPLVVVAGVIVISTRKASAAVRYNCLSGALALFGVVMVAVFVGRYSSAVHTVSNGPNNISNADLQLIGASAYPDLSNKADPIQQGYLQIIKIYLEQNHNTIVLIWLLVICVRSVQLMVGLQGVYRLRNKGVSEVGQVWIDNFNEMIDKLGIKQKVNILASSLIQVPMAIGHLRPLILIPVGLMTALSAAEIESILLHELAHIRRRDYLVNLLQNILEIVFFFNPAVLWLSRLMRDERENCCDDLALAHNSSRADYIRALLNCEELRSAASYAMALSGKKAGLVGRVKRLISKQNHSLDAFEKTLITVCLIVAGICFSAFAGKDRIKKAADVIAKAVLPAEEEPITLEPIKGEKRLRPIVGIPVINMIDSIETIPPPFDPTKATDSVRAKGLDVKRSMQGTFPIVKISWESYVSLDQKKGNKDSTINQKYQAWLGQQKMQREPISAIVANEDVDAWYDQKIEAARVDQSKGKLFFTNGKSKSTNTTTIEASSLNGEVNRYNALRYLDRSDREYYDFRSDKGKKFNDGLIHIPRTQDEHMAFELAKDGIIESDNYSMTHFLYSESGDIVFINGKPLSADLSKKYEKIRSRRTNNPKYLAEPHREARHVINRIILELVNDRIVAKDDDALAALVFDLDDKALVVNGKMQPAKVFKKYYNAFIKLAANDQTTWSYGEVSK